MPDLDKRVPIARFWFWDCLDDFNGNIKWIKIGTNLGLGGNSHYFSKIYIRSTIYTVKGIQKSSQCDSLLCQRKMWKDFRLQSI